MTSVKPREKGSKLKTKIKAKMVETKPIIRVAQLLQTGNPKGLANIMVRRVNPKEKISDTEAMTDGKEKGSATTTTVGKPTGPGEIGEL